MELYADQNESPDNFIGRIARRLRSHSLWDFLLVVAPPVAALFYVLSVLYHYAWLPVLGVLLAAAGLMAIGALAIIFRGRLLPSPLTLAARLLDDKAGAKDHFITLATLRPASGELIDHLRRQTAGLLRRVQIGRDFPYTVKRSFIWSLTGSVLAAGLFHFFLISMVSTAPAGPPQQRIRALAEQMAQRPRLADLARGLQALAAKIEDPQVSPQEKQASIQHMQNQIEEQQDKPEQKDNENILSDAGSLLKTLEGNSAGQQQAQREGGGISGNASQEGQGQAQSQSGGDGKGELSAELNQDMKDGKSTQGDPQEQNAQNPTGPKADQSKSGGSEKTDSDESAAKTMETSREGQSAKNRSDDLPKDGPPAERYYQPGEQGKEGIKGAQYVTVQLPEEVAADGSGVATTSKDAKASRSRPKVPVSNIPLPPHLPDAAAEKQRVPLEYRDLIK
jgi:hypothetical protein